MLQEVKIHLKGESTHRTGLVILGANRIFLPGEVEAITPYLIPKAEGWHLII